MKVKIICKFLLFKKYCYILFHYSFSKKFNSLKFGIFLFHFIENLCYLFYKILELFKKKDLSMIFENKF